MLVCYSFPKDHPPPKRKKAKHKEAQFEKNGFMGMWAQGCIGVGVSFRKDFSRTLRTPFKLVQKPPPLPRVLTRSLGPVQFQGKRVPSVVPRSVSITNTTTALPLRLQLLFNKEPDSQFPSAVFLSSSGKATLIWFAGICLFSVRLL